MGRKKHLSELARFDNMCSHIYADARMPASTRELALTLAWTSLRDPARHGDDSNVTRARRILGNIGNGNWRIDDLILRDLPRYERPRARRGLCDGPRVRPYVRRGYGYTDDEAERRTMDGTRCGADASERVDEHDMITGQITRVWWYCARHRSDMERVRQQLADRGTPPPPIPNNGGLLPCYFQPLAVANLYKEVSPRWEPPYYGICADDWPVPGQDPVPARPKLALIVGGVSEAVLTQA